MTAWPGNRQKLNDKNLKLVFCRASVEKSFVFSSSSKRPGLLSKSTIASDGMLKQSNEVMVADCDDVAFKAEVCNGGIAPSSASTRRENPSLPSGCIFAKHNISTVSDLHECRQLASLVFLLNQHDENPQRSALSRSSCFASIQKYSNRHLRCRDRP